MQPKCVSHGSHAHPFVIRVAHVIEARYRQSKAMLFRGDIDSLLHLFGWLLVFFLCACGKQSSACRRRRQRHITMAS